MPIVFVHGVNNREGPAYRSGKLATQAFLQKHLAGITIRGKPLTTIQKVWFPYWGDLATEFAWNMESLPTKDMQALGGDADLQMQPLVAHTRDALAGAIGAEPLTALAKQNLSLAVDALTQMALDTATTGSEAEVAAFVVNASAYAEANPSPAWLLTVQNDSQLIAELQSQIASQSNIQAMGGLDGIFQKIALAGTKFKQAIAGIINKEIDKQGDFASTKLLAWTRSPLNELLGRFFGDVFVYLDKRGTQKKPGPIPQRILADFDDARAQTAADEPFVIIGHSLGAVITMDLLRYFRSDIEVDLFVSVGSQIAHFEELKLYKSSNKKVVKPEKATTPANIHHWINIFDEVDIFAYAANRVFDRVDVDAQYDTKTYVIKAHSTYFTQDRFYQRLRTRIDSL